MSPSGRHVSVFLHPLISREILHGITPNFVWGCNTNSRRHCSTNYMTRCLNVAEQQTCLRVKMYTLLINSYCPVRKWQRVGHNPVRKWQNEQEMGMLIQNILLTLFVNES